MKVFLSEFTVYLFHFLSSVPISSKTPSGLDHIESFYISLLAALVAPGEIFNIHILAFRKLLFFDIIQ